MNCEQCQNQISAFLDHELDESNSAALREHLIVCDDCAAVCEDLSALLFNCDTDLTDEINDPNSQAMWCRISNVLESEIKPATEQPQEPKGWFARGWQLSFSQLSAAVAAIAVISSLITVLAVNNFSEQEDAVGISRQPSVFDRVLAKVGIVESPQQKFENKLAERKAAIEYWNKRVETRRQHWDADLRRAFDRNLHEIDQAVTDYSRTLENNPEDDISGEMLDSALNEKMDLLREFAEL